MEHRHKHRRKSRHSHQGGLKRFFSTRLLIVLGAVFLLIGLYYSLTSTEGSGIYEIVMKFFTPKSSDTQMNIVSTGNSLGMLCLYFFPGILLLTLSCLFVQNYAKVTYPISLLAAICFIIIQIKIYLNLYIQGCYYSNSLEAFVFLLVSTFMLLSAVFLHRKLVLLILTGLYFYISLVLYINIGIVFVEFLFTFIVLFIASIAWFGIKMKRDSVSLINLIFFISFYGFFFLRKFVVNSKTELLTVFFIFSALFYALFYVIVLYLSKAEEKPLRNWMQLIMTWINLLFFLGIMSFILLKYYTYTHLCVFVPVLLVFNTVGLILIKKYYPTVWLLPHYYDLIFLASLVLPILFQQNRVFLFTAGASVFMLLYAIRFKNKAALWISHAIMVVTVGLYFFLWIVSYLPAIITIRVLPEAGLMWNGILSGVVMLVVLSVMKWCLNEAMLPTSKKWFNGKNYLKSITVFLLITLFLIMGWVAFSSICLLTGTGMFSLVGWFISGTTFFILLIQHFAGKHSDLKKPLLYLGFIYALIYPLLLGWNVTQEKLIHSGNLNLPAFLLHYLALFLLIVLGAMTIKRIYQRNTKYLFLKQGVQILAVIYLAFLLCTEYDNLSVLIAAIENGSNSSYQLGTTVLSLNSYIPYSIIGWILSVFVFIYAIYKKKPLLKSCAIFLFIGTLIKVFAYDFQTLATGERSAVFFALGIFLIVFALLYPRMVKVAQVEVRNKRSKEEVVR